MRAVDIMEEGMKWIRENKYAYQSMKFGARLDAYINRETRIAQLVEDERKKGVKVPNAIRSYLARRIERELKAEGVPCRFTRSRSKIDPLMEKDDD